MHSHGEIANREAPIASVMNHLAGPDFPAELLLQVIETTVASQVGHWKVTESHDLGHLAESLFAWPDGVTIATRGLLQEITATVLLDRCTIRIPVGLNYREPPQYKIPPALLGRESHVKHLVLDLDVGIGTNSNREMALSINHMDLLAETFPRLADCTYLLHFKYDPRIVSSGTSLEAIILECQNYRRGTFSGPFEYGEWVTVEDSLVDFIAAFARSGLGKRKLLRFSRQQIIFQSGKRRHPSEFRPLVNVSSPGISSTADAVEDALASEREQSVANAKRILDEAYRGPWKSR